MRHRAWLVAVLVGVVLLSVSPAIASEFPAGSGTPEDPYLVTTCVGLQAMNDNLAASYTLANDIDCSDTVNWNGGAGFVPIGNAQAFYRGVFDGRHHTIKGLFIYRPTEGPVGLFGIAANTLRNVMLVDVDVTGFSGVGALAGIAHYARVEHASVTGVVTGDWATIGGLVGQNYFAEIGTSYSGAHVVGVTYVGGLVGESLGGRIHNSYATGSVRGSDPVGGLVGASSAGAAPVINSYSTGAVTDDAYYGAPNAFGGLIGCNVNYDGPAYSVFGSFWDIETSSQPTSNGGTGRTTAEMRQQATFVGWDFANVWSIDNGGSYPTLRWLTPENPWNFVTIPGLPAGTQLGRLWTDRPGNLYVWAQTPGPGAVLYHWDGQSWTQPISRPGWNPWFVFGTGPSDVFASAYDSVSNLPKMFHFDGTTWAEQRLPADLIGTPLKMEGEAGNIYSVASSTAGTNYVIRYDGTSWQKVTAVGEGHLTAYVSRDEIYVIDCWGHWLGNANGRSWRRFQGFDFCDVNHAWGMRDEHNALHLYATGNNNFGNRVAVWRFTETYAGSMTGSWGSKYGTVFSDPPNYGYYVAGTGLGIWGSGPDDIFVIGARPAWEMGSDDGRVYHFNGTAWNRMTGFGDIYRTYGIWGTGSNDVWISTGDRLLHYGRPEPANLPPVALAIDRTVEAGPGGTGGASVDIGSFDPDGDAITVAQVPPGPYAIGVTGVTLAVTDSHGATTEATATVTVVDTTPPVVTAPANQVFDATGPSGASYAPAASATDIVDASLPATCSPAGTFAIGTTTVTCAATDTHGNTGTASFTVTVRSPSQMTTSLLTTVATVGFQQSSGLLQNALGSLEGGQAGAACNQLGAFINQVQAQTGKKLSPAQASQLLQAATRVKTAIGCR